MTKIKISKMKKLTSKGIIILSVGLVSTLLLFNESISAFLGEKINIPFINNSNKTIQTTPQQDSIKTIKSTCVSEVKKYIETDDDKFTAIKKQNMFKGTGWSVEKDKALRFAETKGFSVKKTEGWLDYVEDMYKKQMEDFVWQVNSKYRFCLAENGLTPEDLLASPNQLNFDTTENVSNPQNTTKNIFQNTTKNLFEEAEKDELERKQECQNKMNKYNICLSEYNSKISEYNLCMNNPKKPSWSCGFEPQNSCSKPIGCL